MLTQAEVRHQLAAFLQNRLSLDDFEDWLADRSWNMHLDSPPAAQELVASIELPLFEYSSGHRDLDSLRVEIRKLLDQIRLAVVVGTVAPISVRESLANSSQAQVPSAVRLEPA